MCISFYTVARGGAPKGLEFGAPNASSNIFWLRPCAGAGAVAGVGEKAASRRPGLGLGAVAAAGADSRGAGLTVSN